MTTTAAHAVGLDRSNQDITAIFEEGNYVELSFGSITPSVSGADIPTPTTYDGVALDFTQLSGSLTYQINEQISMAVIIDQPSALTFYTPVCPQQVCSVEQRQS